MSAHTAISDADFLERDDELRSLFGRADAAAPQREESEATLESQESLESQERADRILQKVQFEAVMKDTTSFLFKTMGVGIDGLAVALFGVLDEGLEAESGPVDEESP